MNKPELDRSNQTALLRYKVINWIEERIADGFRLAEALREASSRPWPEDASGDYYAARTIEDWWYAHRQGGFAALCPKARSDSGNSRVINEATGLRLIELVEKYPRMAVKVWWRLYKEQGETLPALSSVYRYLRRHGFDSKGLRRGRLESGPTKTFETARVNDLWMVDFSPGPKLRTATGAVLATQLCVIIDDHSRLIPFCFYALRADTEAFLHALKEAVSRRGLPVKLYTDQGKPFVCEHARVTCANLGIRLLHARPYHAWSKGKVERIIRTIQDDFEAGLRIDSRAAASLEELNRKLWNWVESAYHQRPHGSTKESPLSRYQRAVGTLRQLPPEADLEALFFTRLDRTVRKDGTVLIDKELYEVPLHLRGLRVELRYDPFSKKRIDVWHEKRRVGAARLANRQLNSEIGGGISYER